MAKKQVNSFNLSSLDGVYDVQINKAAPAARRSRDASKTGKVAAAAESSQTTDDARARAVEYGFDPDAKLPTGFFG